MTPSREQVLRHFIEVLSSIDEDQDPEDLTEDMFLIGDTSWRSIEIAYIASEIQSHWGRTFPFEKLFEEISARENQDITVGEWVDFVWRHLQEPDAAPEPAG